MQHDLETALPLDVEAAFEEPWQAEAFALAVTLSAAGCYSWEEWTAVFSRRLKAAEYCDASKPIGYFDAWLEALEELVTAKGIADLPSLLARKIEWIAAYESTPHGKPVMLPKNEDIF